LGCVCLRNCLLGFTSMQTPIFDGIVVLKRRGLGAGDRNSPMKLEFKNVELMGSKGWRVKSEWTPPRGKTTGGIQQILDFIEAPTTYSIKLCFPGVLTHAPPSCAHPISPVATPPIVSQHIRGGATPVLEFVVVMYALLSFALHHLCSMQCQGTGSVCSIADVIACS
jgi:hypothetical protein